MAVTDRAAKLTAELRLDVQEFYARYAECLDGGRLQQWPNYFLGACTYRIVTRRSLKLGPEADLLSFTGKTGMRDSILAIGQSEDYEPHLQRHGISNFRIQAGGVDELRVQASFQIFRTFPEQRTEFFIAGYYDDRISISGGRLHFREKLCVLDSDERPGLLVYPI
jgi:3-phenylpropionate/cinnamic acid dioxygenase small subunit